MNCPNCGGKIFDGCCVKCGYLNNGNKISLKDKKDKNEDVKIYQKNFDIMLHNNNWYIPFIIGPLYLSYKGYLVLGAILTYLDLLIYYLILMIPSVLPSKLLVLPFFSQLGMYTFILYFIISKLLYSATLNSLCLELDKKKTEKIKNNNPKNYKNILAKHSNHVLFPIIAILILIMFLFILIMIRRIQNGTINNFII